MDNVLALGALFNLFLFLIFLIIVAYAVYIFKKVKIATENNYDLASAFYKQKVHIVVFIILTASFVSYLSIQTAFRPKNSISQTNAVLQQKLKRIDNSTVGELKPAEGDKRDKQNKGYSQRNTQENKEAIEAFKNLE
ncbi:hypothetical protein CSB11_01045 [Candidatus Campbellbacteria bacterium]|nr:MAG: hypothetical protein CSB11_01045 [Candidatus Campbellbacteria bacterium]